MQIDAALCRAIRSTNRATIDRPRPVSPRRRIRDASRIVPLVRIVCLNLTRSYVICSGGIRLSTVNIILRGFVREDRRSCWNPIRVRVRPKIGSNLFHWFEIGPAGTNLRLGRSAQLSSFESRCVCTFLLTVELARVSAKLYDIESRNGKLLGPRIRP